MALLELSAHMTVRPGSLEGFKKQAAECIRITRTAPWQPLPARARHRPTPQMDGRARRPDARPDPERRDAVAIRHPGGRGASRTNRQRCRRRGTHTMFPDRFISSIGLPIRDADMALKELNRVGRFHYDYLTYHPEGFRFLLSLVGSDRVVVGTDSFNARDIEYPSAVVEQFKLPAVDRERILWGMRYGSSVSNPKAPRAHLRSKPDDLPLCLGASVVHDQYASHVLPLLDHQNSNCALNLNNRPPMVS